MASIVSYNNDKVVVGEVEYPAGDPASGAFFQPDYKKNDDLKLMLDGSKDSLKLEAMKRIIGMIAKGRDASDLFPAVVKNVVSKNIEVKKLVYVYLVRYAEEQQDLALLSISTFQRALKDPNQLIRASALRVLSSIRVNMIVPIVMLAIRDSSSDMSPYVRKTAAHAIPKLYSLDPEQKEELVSIIDKLLSDKAPLVVGSAAMAFSEVCPDRMSLIHRSYRKLCALLADVDEWGQLALLTVLTVYARTCFPDPNKEEYMSDSEPEAPFYESDASSGTRTRTAPSVDPDLRLLLRAAKPLLQSRNAGVVTAVAQLYHHCAPSQELPPVAKAMIRLLRAPLEVQSVILNSIASLTVNKRSLFEPFLKSFFVRNSDPTHIKLLKLEILTNLATEASAAVVLREFQTYVTSNDKTFAAHTIQAIGRLAVAIHTETEHCLNGLLQLLSSKDEWVVCEAVVVVKRVVGGGAASAPAAVARAAKLLRQDRLCGAARAAGVWLVAEHGAEHPRAAAVLAHLVSVFPEQDELVKLQLLSLAVKLSITQPDTLPMCQYVCAVARYDASYDVRDRARMLRRFLHAPGGGAGGGAGGGGQLHAHRGDVFRPDKPQPTVESSFKDRQQWTLGTLSQYVGSAACGYRPLPAPPPAPLHAARRDPPEVIPDPVRPANENQKNKSFYSEPESSGSGSESQSASSSEESSDEDESTNDSDKKDVKRSKENNNYRSSSGTSESESDSETSGSASASDSSDEEAKELPKNDKKIKEAPSKQTAQKNAKSNLELLLELDAVGDSLPTMTPTCGGFLSPDVAVKDEDDITPVGPSLVPARVELVGRVSLGGLCCSLQWTRTPHLHSARCTALQLTFTNNSGREVKDIDLVKKASCQQEMSGYVTIPVLAAGASAAVPLGVDFADSIQPLEGAITCSIGELSISITPPVGELVRAVSMSEARWLSEHRKLRGMTECQKKTPKIEDEATICKRVFSTANLAFISSTGELLRFAGRMLSSGDLVLVSVEVAAGGDVITANCPNMAVASLLAADLANKFVRG